jgi:uncharacterized repeat protein (TIGR03803 family)
MTVGSAMARFGTIVPDAKFTTIYSFKGTPDGARPQAPLVGVMRSNELLFVGTTFQGGTQDHGTVFDMKINGEEHVDHSFTSGPDGSKPKAGLTEGLEGTTEFGGAENEGTIYDVQLPAGKERVLYSFGGQPDGTPDGDLIAFDGKLYGTTVFGGSGGCNQGCGTVFEIGKGDKGTERVVYSFGGTPDGSNPHGGLTAFKGALYGTTGLGGANRKGCVFKVLANGTEQVVYSFKGAPDGALPLAGLTVMNGLLYGVTSDGGANAGLSGSGGTVFQIDEHGTERVLHSFKFKSTSEGWSPRAQLTVLQGKLYGTTREGGKSNQGTLFEVHADGASRVLHQFEGPDGAYPDALTPVFSNMLIGTTLRGGSHDKGTIFLIQV